MLWSISLTEYPYFQFLEIIVQLYMQKYMVQPSNVEVEGIFYIKNNQVSVYNIRGIANNNNDWTIFLQYDLHVSPLNRTRFYTFIS